MNKMSDHRTILDEHKGLDLLVRDLRIVCTWRMELLQQHKVRVKLAQDVRALKDRLRHHFATEESGSYLEEISNRKPSARKTLVELHGEHMMFLNQLTEVEKSCAEYDQEAIVTPALSQLLDVLDMLKLHEQRETALIQEVFSV
jgi:Hemerythrin HHE cation binding domain